MTPQHYQTADQSAYIGVAGNNEANAYLRYKMELDRQRREAEEAKRKAAGAWWKRALVNGVGGAVAGIPGGPGGIAAGFAAGAGLSALGDASGMNGLSYGGGGAQLGGMAGNAAGKAFSRWATERTPAATSTPLPTEIPNYQLTPPSGYFDMSGSGGVPGDIDYRKYYSGFGGSQY